MVLFMDLGYLPCHGALSVRTEDLSELLKRLYKPSRCLIENHCSCLGGQLTKKSLPPLFLRQKALEAKSVTRESG